MSTLVAPKLTRRMEAGMGEVRIKIRLANAADETLVRRGLLAADQVHTLETEALVDTGAVQSVMPETIMKQLGLASAYQRIVRYADGRTDWVPVTEGVYIEWDGRRTLEGALVLGDEVLIGQTVLEVWDAFVDCTNQRLVPNPANPQGPVLNVK